MNRHCCPPPATAHDPGFLNALDLDRVTALVRAHVCVDAELLELRPDYVRWKERDGSLLGYRATIVHGGETHTNYVTLRTAGHTVSPTRPSASRAAAPTCTTACARSRSCRTPTACC